MNLFGVNPRFHIGYFVYKAGGRLGPRIQQNLQLVYIFEGEAVIRLDGKDHHLRRREATLLLPGREERFIFSQRGVTRHGWCEVDRPHVDGPVLRAYQRLPFSLPFSRRMEQLAALGLPLGKDPRRSVQRLRDTLAQAILLEFLAQAKFGDRDAPPLPEPVRRACEHMETHHAAPCDLCLLSKVASVTGAHLIRLFRKHLGTTPIEFLWKTRAETGARLLVETGLSVSEVAYRTGFQSPYHFSRLVRRHLGQSPREYRRSAWGQ